MKQFILTEETAKAEFELLKTIWLEFKDNPIGLFDLEIKTNSGVFENKGGFNGNHFDLWLIKKGTTGQTKKTFWRVGLGNNKHFKLFRFDQRFEQCLSGKSALEMAKKIGAILSEDGYYFMFNNGDAYTTKEDMLNYIDNNYDVVKGKLDYLDELKSNNNKEIWQKEANSLIMQVSNNDFRLLKWKEIYELIKNKVKNGK